MQEGLRRSMLGVLSFLAAMLGAGAPAGAQGWPERPVKFIVPVSTGGASDIAARLIAERLTQALGRSVYVENIAGGMGLIAAQTAARADPDGYTYYLGGVGVIAADRHLFKSLPYNPDRDFTPVAMMYRATVFVLAVHPSVAAKNVPELIALAKENPGKLSYGTGPVGVQGMPGMWFNKLAGTEMVAVPYNRAAQMMQDAVAGRIQVVFTAISAVEPFRKAGRLRMLGVTSSRRVPGWDDVQTIAETLPGYDIVGIGILMAPTGTPDVIVQRLNREIDGILKDPEVAKRLVVHGITIAGAGTQQSIAGFMRAQRENWDRMLTEMQIEPR